MGDEPHEPHPSDDAPEAAEPSAPEAPAPAEDWATRFKYLFADFENFRRRADRERESISRQTRGAMLRELLPIVEAFRSARAAVARLPAHDPVRHGLDLLDREWSKFLKQEGVEAIAEVGRPFAADEAEAVGEAPPRDGVAEGTVAEVVQQGYRFFGGTLRPAKVIVARSPASARPAPAAEPVVEASSEEKP